ncbi:hypothetical protein LCGC14_0906850 [marine sediment metagenome]|uniref:Uncharacterized protein n=1 Tax=marine sediment metagenome TaxID=412755 RepID=A0A0F9NUR5_9ZZZZ
MRARNVPTTADKGRQPKKFGAATTAAGPHAADGAALRARVVFGRGRRGARAPRRPRPIRRKYCASFRCGGYASAQLAPGRASTLGMDTLCGGYGAAQLAPGRASTLGDFL